MNKDEAEKCLELGKKVLLEGDFAKVLIKITLEYFKKALKMFNKSNSMHPSEIAEAYIERAKKLMEGKTTSPNSD